MTVIKQINYDYIHSIIKKVWKDDISLDYKSSFLLKEDTLKNAFYYHLRKRIGDDYLVKNNLRVFTEYFLEGERIDLVIVEIDPLKAKNDYLGNCVISVVAAIEMKYKGSSCNEVYFDQDITKLLSYIDRMHKKTMLYSAFIREKEFYSHETTYWLPDESIDRAKGKITELYSFIDIDKNNMVWMVKEHL